jgi:DNA-binding response OmpR family regulator
MNEMTIAPWVVELQAEGMSESLKLLVDEPLLIGRADVHGEFAPDVDLGPYGAEERGVSRRHVVLHADHNALFVTDLNSHNGTQLNGKRLESDKPYVLHYDDVLHLGHMPLTVRVVVSPNQGSISQAQADVRVDIEQYEGQGESLLIVEDDTAVANVLSLILKRSGYTPIITHDVIGAIRAFNQKRPSAVILDLMLPDMNGLEFCRYVRRDVERNNVPVIVVSAVKSKDHVARALDAGADIFLGKPVSAQELQQVVGSMIRQRQGGANTMATRHLPGTAPLNAIAPESRRDAVVFFVAGHSDVPITLTVKDTVSFGRNTTSVGRAHIDLSRYNAIDNGVSRIHAYLHRQQGKFYIEDADSVNGTFINGNPLQPGTRTSVNNADEVRLGQLRMYIYFLTDKDDPLFGG